MTLLVDECRWPWRGRRWCHLVSDDGLPELHRFARRLGLPRRAFQGDHYDLHEDGRAAALALGAAAVPSRELLDRLRAAGLRLSPAERRDRPRPLPVRLDPEAWLGAPATVLVDRPVGAPHAYAGTPFPLNVGMVARSAGFDGEPVDAYVLGPRTPERHVVGTVVAVVRRHDDVEDRVVVATPDAQERDRATIAAAIAFQERWFDTELVLRGG